jgi:alkaline phosphatase D
MTRRGATQALIILASGLTATAAHGQGAFPQGVASGDVTDTSAILWTRSPPEGAVAVQLGPDEGFSEVTWSANLWASAEVDFTVSVDATGLQPERTYHFRFVRTDSGETSVVGHFRTAPRPDSHAPLRFVYSGDSNASSRPFRLLKFAAAENPDLWFWAGDTVYGDDVADGLPTATDIDGYRAKHRQNREDPFLRNLLAAAPVYAQWDDHEVANDYDGGDIEPGIGADRMVAGQRAFFEYMPIRAQGAEDDPRRIYRSFRYGSLAEFFILDCRQYRSADLSRDGGGIDPRGFFLPLREANIVSRLQDSNRTMLGAAQLAWLKTALIASTAKWKFILSSVPFTSLLIRPYDRWDGYEAERYDLLRFIDESGVSGVVLLSADIHANLHNPDVTRFQRSRLGAEYSPCFAVPEFVAGPIATRTFRQEVDIFGGQLFGQSPGDLESSIPFNLLVGIVQLRVINESGLSFAEGDRFSYLVIDVGPESLTATYRGIPSDPTLESPALQTLYTTTVVEPSPRSCGPGLPLPICLVAAVGFGFARRRI